MNIRLSVGCGGWFRLSGAAIKGSGITIWWLQLEIPMSRVAEKSTIAATTLSGFMLMLNFNLVATAWL